MKTLHDQTLARIVGLALLLSGISMPLHAAEPTSPALTEQPNSSVKAWLELQSSGQAASNQPQPLTGPVMDRVHSRYLESFTHPIPPYFEHVQLLNN